MKTGRASLIGARPFVLDKSEVEVYDCAGPISTGGRYMSYEWDVHILLLGVKVVSFVSFQDSVRQSLRRRDIMCKSVFYHEPALMRAAETAARIETLDIVYLSSALWLRRSAVELGFPALARVLAEHTNKPRVTFHHPRFQPLQGIFEAAGVPIDDSYIWKAVNKRLEERTRLAEVSVA